MHYACHQGVGCGLVLSLLPSESVPLRSHGPCSCVTSRVHTHTSEVSGLVCSDYPSALCTLFMFRSPCSQTSSLCGHCQPSRDFIHSWSTESVFPYNAVARHVALYQTQRGTYIEKKWQFDCILVQGLLSNSTVIPVTLPFLCGRWFI